MDDDLHDVVGILFADLHTPEEVKILYTAHAEVGSDGMPVSPTRSRLEASLFAPMECILDLAIVVRKSSTDDHKTSHRLEHEIGHAEHTLSDVIATLTGPQTWNADSGHGRRSELVFRWRDRVLNRTWRGYRNQEARLQTRRVYITVLPPTRWSKLFTKPSESISQQDRLVFNDQLTRLHGRFRDNWERSRLQFHVEHGAAERERLPDFPGPRTWP
jgi:hypothetical protein